MQYIILLPIDQARANVEKDMFSLEDDQARTWSVKKRLSMYLLDFRLEKEMVRFIPPFFNPRFNLTPLFIIWDTGGVLEIVPGQNIEAMEEFQFSFGEKNVRRVKKSRLLLFNDKLIVDRLNVLIFLLENDREGMALKKLRHWIEQSTFYRVNRLKSKMNLSIPLSRKVNKFITSSTKAIDERGFFCIPLLSLYLEGNEFENKSSIRLDAFDFKLNFEFLECQ